MDDGFRVRPRAQDVALSLQHGAQLDIVIDLAVEHDPDRSVLVRDRLLARLQVDDAQAAHPQGDAILHVKPVAIWPAMGDDLEAIRMARDIAKKIEETMQYPGQIKVTVIRETRAVDFAK